jgi:hypothetical protein
MPYYAETGYSRPLIAYFTDNSIIINLWLLYLNSMNRSHPSSFLRNQGDSRDNLDLDEINKNLEHLLQHIGSTPIVF